MLLKPYPMKVSPRRFSLGPLPRRPNPQLLLALILAFIYHGALLLSGTFRQTYDAYIHIFFADHYVRAWFDHWEYRWYAGFPIISYPPGSQQSVALASFVVGGLQNGFIAVQLFSILMVVLGMYRFAKIWVSEEAAGYAALLTVFASSISQTVHVFGQLPTTFAIGFLLNALPYIRRWLEKGSWRDLLAAWVFNAAATAGHHFTTLFGAVFFITPVVALVLIEKFQQPLVDEFPYQVVHISRRNIKALAARYLRRILPVSVRVGIYAVGLVIAVVVVVLPYWLYALSDNVHLFPIPHSSRDSFITNLNAGLVFWLTPYGLSVLALPYVFYKGLTTKGWPLALSVAILFLLGTGGTTPIPRFLLRGTFDILTFDRFTFWATISMIPLLGEMVVSLRHGVLAKYLQKHLGFTGWRGVQIALLLSYLGISIFVADSVQFLHLQPDPIDMRPIVDFLEKDQHSRWRYLTLGFGDQMAWLSAQTSATSIDGDYNSARRLPELVASPAERLEDAKNSGIQGIDTLQQILAVPEKYNLKFIFSNDQFYDPLLYYSGWHRLQRLGNGTVLWEREDIPPLPEVLPRQEIPMYQRIMWGTVPMFSIFLALASISACVWCPLLRKLLDFLGVTAFLKRLRRVQAGSSRILCTPRYIYYRAVANVDSSLLRWSQLPRTEEEVQCVEHLRMRRNWLLGSKQWKPVPRRVLGGIVCSVILLSLISSIFWLVPQKNDPLTLVRQYYDDLGFHRYNSAYDYLDPQTRPSFGQYVQSLSTANELLTSYGKLDVVHIHVLKSEAEHVEVRVDTQWLTSLLEYPDTQQLDLIKRDNNWYIVPQPIDVTLPPDQFSHQRELTWYMQSGMLTRGGTPISGDGLDRPVLQVLSARLVKVRNRYSVVGELVNTDVYPADATVTASLYDDKGNILSTYEAQTAMIHNIFPKEVTPFRVDFEGVTAAGLNDAITMKDVQRSAGALLHLEAPIASFYVSAKAVVTGRDLLRGLATRNVSVHIAADGKVHLTGQLFNSSTLEATVPHILVTYYDTNNQVIWVDSYFVENAVNPEHAASFDLTVTPPGEITIVLNAGKTYSDVLAGKHNLQLPQLLWSERLPLPEELGYNSLRVSVNYFVGNI